MRSHGNSSGTWWRSWTGEVRSADCGVRNEWPDLDLTAKGSKISKRTANRRQSTRRLIWSVVSGFCRNLQLFAPICGACGCFFPLRTQRFQTPKGFGVGRARGRPRKLSGGPSSAPTMGAEDRSFRTGTCLPGTSRDAILKCQRARNHQVVSAKLGFEQRNKPRPGAFAP